MDVKRILVTGATGFLGSRTVEHLAKMDDVCVVATGRTIKPHNEVKASNVTYSLGDLADAETVDHLVKGVDAIVHAAALSSPWGRRDAFWNANVEPTRLLLEAAARHGVKRFVFVSTPSMYFEMKPQLGITEEHPLPRPINQYAASKREAERLVTSSKIPHVVLRPRALIGRGDTVILPRVLRAHAEGRLRQMGSGKNKVDMTPVVNVVDAIVLGLNAEGEALNQVYNISNGEPVALWPMLNGVLKKLSLAPISKSVPLPMVLAVARAMEWHARLFNGHREPALTVYGVGTLAMDFSMDITKARERLGYVPRQSVEEALDEFVAWHVNRNT